MSNKTSLALALALASFTTPVFVQNALAQDVTPTSDAAPAEGRTGVLVFTIADFAASRPNTALDMISRMPGFSLEGGDQVRGFAGAAGNVLIDGRRPTIKTDSLQDTLGRIPVDQVERIELIRGGAPGIDMQGRTVIANVVRKRTDTFQQVATATVNAFAETGATIPGWNYQATRRAGDHQFDFQIGRGISMDDSSGFGWRSTRDTATGDTIYVDSKNEGDGLVHSARANYKGPLFGGDFSVNGLISSDEFKSEERFGVGAGREQYVNRTANDRGEIGLNFTRPLGAGLELELVGLSKLAIGSGDSTGDAGGDTSLFQQEAEAGESIGRAVLRYAATPQLSFEGGGETAFNYRDQQVGLLVNGQPITLTASDVRVEELRGEVFGQATWRPTPKLSFEGGVRVERSTITQSGDTDLERSFDYAKPRFVASWSPSEGDQVRLRIEREIGQLNFRDFASDVSLDSNVLSAGNAGLEPDKTWIYEAAFEKRFWDDGALVLTLRHEDIADVVDLFPFVVLVDDNDDGVPDDANNDGFPDERLVAGPGNIGDGTNDVINIDLTVPLKKLGLAGAEIKVEAMWQNSEVRDPLTGDARRISGQRPDDVNVSFRQDLPGLNLSFGINWYAGWSESYYRLEDEQHLDLRTFAGTFIEYKPTSRFTLRGDLNNIDPYRFNIERRIFDGPRDTGQMVEIENQRRNSQIMARVRARWSFG